MRILIFHGYLLSGTGSNVYNARLAAALVRMGHEVHLLTQEPHPERHSFVDAVGVWEGGALRVRRLEQRPGRAQSLGQLPVRAQHLGERPVRAQHLGERPVRCTVYRPDIGGLLPVYVPDRYEGVQARTFLQCSAEQIAAYVQSNVDAVREVAELVHPDVALANHLVMGPLILARGLAGAVPYAVKVHGSALEYTVKRDPQRFLEPAREGLAGANAVLVGSRHTAESLWEALDDPALERRTRLGPPGVDVELFAPRERERAWGAMRELISRLRSGNPAEEQLGDTFARDEHAAAAALQRIAGAGPLVGFVGKLIVSKGVDLLIAAWPLVLARRPDARLLIVGFGAYREGLERLLGALASEDLPAVRELALAGRSLELAAGGESGEVSAKPLRYLLGFLDSLGAEQLEGYLAASRALPERVALSGRLEHEELADVLPACEVLVVPSTFPEAFGMVAAEAAACGVIPVSARHSGLAEVSDALGRALPGVLSDRLSFELGDRAVWEIAERVLAWLEADPRLLASAREHLVEVVRERWSWEGVGRGVIAAARGELEALELPR